MMSPTRRDLLKASAGFIAATLAPPVVVERASVEPVATWEFGLPVVLECSDGRRMVVLVNPEYTMVNVYSTKDADYQDYDNVVFDGDVGMEIRKAMLSLTNAMAKTLIDQGAM